MEDLALKFPQINTTHTHAHLTQLWNNSCTQIWVFVFVCARGSLCVYLIPHTLWMVRLGTSSNAQTTSPPRPSLSFQHPVTKGADHHRQIGALGEPSSFRALSIDSSSVCDVMRKRVLSTEQVPDLLQTRVSERYAGRHSAVRHVHCSRWG